MIGLALATLFSSDPDASPRLYRADLAGAGLGALLAIPLLNLLNPISGLFVAAGLLGLAGLILAAGDRQSGHNTGFTMALPMVVMLAGLVLLGGDLRSGAFDVNMAALPAQKPIAESLAGKGHIVHTTWNSFARTDLVDPGDGEPYRLYMDGAAGSVMPPAQNTDPLLLDIGLFPFATAQPQSVFIIGPGGGLDVWFGLLAQSEQITAVEVNPGSVDMVRAFAGYNGDLYSQPAVRVAVDEGRSLLRRQGGNLRPDLPVPGGDPRRRAQRLRPGRKQRHHGGGVPGLSGSPDAGGPDRPQALRRTDPDPRPVHGPGRLPRPGPLRRASV